jgi:lipid-A-disaccharide synthase
MDYDLIIVAGEPSGDEHAACMLNHLKLINPDLKIAAVCGPQMRQAYPLKEILGIEKLSIMGFVDVLKNLGKLFFAYRKILNFILRSNAQLVLFVDYPGMNLKLAKTLRKKGFKGKLWHYIAPTAWAWKKSRVYTLKQCCDHLFCILPFEQEFFTSYGIKTSYIGHPLVQKLKNDLEPIDKDPYLIGIFPGSRVHEIEKNLKPVLEALVPILNSHPHHRLGISIARAELKTLIENHVQSYNLQSRVIYDNDTLKLMKLATFAVAKSGTCNLELALLGTPTLVIYAISKLDLWIARSLFKINLPFYSLPNLILHKQVFQELYGPLFNQEKLTFHINELIHSKHLASPSLELLDHLGLCDPGLKLATQLSSYLQSTH